MKKTPTTHFDQSVITVIMPAYNHERYIAEAIDSIRNQTFQNWKLIVIDDGSTDKTWPILCEYIETAKDPRIHLYQQANAGSHATMNRGLTMGTSKYIAILNSDDRYAPNRLQFLYEKAEETQSEVLVTTGVRLIDENGKGIGTEHWWSKMYREQLAHWQACRNDPNNPNVQALLWGNFTVSTSNFFFSRSLSNRLGPFKHLRYIPDWEFALRVASESQEHFLFLPEDRSLDYRLHGQNTILGGALRNHAEATHMLRTFQKKWVSNGHTISRQAIDRIHYLTRFVRHEHARQLLEHQKVGWVEQVNAYKNEIVLAEERAQQCQIEAEKNKIEAEKNKIEAEKNKIEVNQYQQLVAQMQASRSWRWMKPLRRFNGLLQWVRRSLINVFYKLTAKLRSEDRPSEPGAYNQWLNSEKTMLESLKFDLTTILDSMTDKPLISVVMPVHDTPPEFLSAAVQSVISQWYGYWELCICDDFSSRVETLQLLDRFAKSDSRIKVMRRQQTGHIVLATNDAIRHAQGSHVVFLDHDDQLAPQALLRLVQTLNAKPAIDLIYSDEDKLDDDGKRCLPFFKPDWSPILLWSQNYIGHLVCIRRSLLTLLHGLRKDTQGSQDHDLLLRVAQNGARVEHLPEVLYHWQMHSASTASNANSKPYAHETGRQAVQSHLIDRYGAQFDHMEESDHMFVYRPRFTIRPNTLASIIIPTRDNVALLQDCLESIFQTTHGVSYEIIVLDNGSVEPATKSYFEKLRNKPQVCIVNAAMPFNWSRLNNLGRIHANGQLLVFLNNDTKIISPDWLRRMAEYALLPDVATVGAMLLYPDNTIQHAGVVVGMGGWADHVFKNMLPVHYPSPYVSAVLPRNVLANTGACLAIATERFDQLGGFDESFEICGSDVELGIRAHNLGYQNAYVADVRLYHFESKTRSSHVPDNDFEQSLRKYAPYRLGGDPFFNQNLDLLNVNPTPLFHQSSDTKVI